MNDPMATARRIPGSSRARQSVFEASCTDARTSDVSRSTSSSER